MDDPVGNMMLAALLATDAKVPTLLTKEQLKQAEDYLTKLKKEQVRVVAVSWGDLADALSRGDVAITFSGWETIKKFCADKGKKVGWGSDGTPGGGAEKGTAAPAATPASAEAAKPASTSGNDQAAPAETGKPEKASPEKPATPETASP